MVADRRTRNLQIVLFGVLLAVLLLLRESGEWQIAKRAIGVELAETEEALVVEWLELDGAAAGAGMRVGDEIVAIGGRSVSGFEDYDAAADSFDSNRAVAFTLRRDGSEVSLAVTPGRPVPVATELANALACLCFFLLAALAHGQATPDSRARLLSLYSAAIALELSMPFDLPMSPWVALVSYPFFSLLVGVQMALELDLVASIPERRFEERPWVVRAFYVFGLGVGLVHAVSVLADSMGWSFPLSTELVDTLFWEVAMAAWALGVLFLLALPALRWPEPLGRLQAGLVLVGATPWSLLLLYRVTADRVGWPTAWIEVVDPFVILAMPLALFAAVYRYQLFDLELVVKRSMLYGALTTVLVVFFFGVLLSVGAVVSTWLPQSKGTLAGVAAGALLSGLLFNPLRQALNGVVERRLFPERRALRLHLTELASELPALGNLSAMGTELVVRLREIFGLTWSAVLLTEGHSGLMVTLAADGLEPGQGDDLLLSSTDPGVRLLMRARRPLEVDKVVVRSAYLRQRLKQLKAELLAPLIRREQLVGVLILGGKSPSEPFRAEEVELLGLLTHHVTSVFDNAQLFESATRDSLTGLLRREAILDRLDRELRRAQRFNRHLTIGMADLDHFKNVNDRYGHLVGDLMLKQVASALSRGLRATDLVGRYGGEEFLVVLTETDLKGAFTVADKARRLVEEIEVPAAGGLAKVTLSIGLAGREQLAADRQPSATALIDQADQALYAAKTAGRNRVDSLRAN